MLEVQKFLRNGGTLLRLLETYAIKSVRSLSYPNLVLLKYNQVESPFKENIVQECRGLILDENNNWELISYGFRKFFNAGEHLAAPIDWESAVIQEKCDGSYVCLYYYKDEWHVQTSGTPDASGQVGDTEFTFAELFWKVFKEKGHKLPEKELYHCCFVFELMI